MADQHIDSVAPQGNPDKPPAEPPQNPPVIPQVPPPVAHTPERAYSNPDPTPLWKIVLECAAIAVGITVAIIYYYQLDAMQRQLELTDRPWIKLDITPCTVCGERDIRGGPLTFDKDGRGSLTFRVTFVNVGKSVANHVSLRYEPIAIDSLDSKSLFKVPLEEQKNVCASTSTKGLDIGTVFPDDPDLPPIFSPGIMRLSPGLGFRTWSL
jgi:hypothetical protein